MIWVGGQGQGRRNEKEGWWCEELPFQEKSNSRRTDKGHFL